MFMVSAHMDVLRDIESGRTTLLHRGRSLKLIKECLQHENSRPSDLLILTVVGLVSYEVSSSDSTFYKVRLLIWYTS